MAVDFEKLAREGMPADQLAKVFLREYYKDKEISYPINPFQMLSDLKIAFVLRPFNKYERIYIPAEDEGDFPIVGINLKRPIVRQRFTAAYCSETNQNLIEVAGLTLAYDYAFGNIENEISVYDAKHLNEQLFSTAPCPEFGGAIESQIRWCWELNSKPSIIEKYRKKCISWIKISRSLWMDLKD